MWVINKTISAQNGIALMLVMWVLTLLTIMAVALTAAQRTETALTENQITDARFRALADAAIAYTALDFVTQSTETTENQTSNTNSNNNKIKTMDSNETESITWLPNGSSRTWRFIGTELNISVFNEASRINLNQADLSTLTALLIALEVPDKEADALASAIIDWRDEDNMALPNGAEDEAYEKEGRALGAKDSAFIAVEELQQVLGMTPEIYHRIAPEVTVEGDSKTPVEDFASAAVISAMRGITFKEATQIVTERNTSSFLDDTKVVNQNRGGPLYRLQIQESGTTKNGRKMEALIETASGQNPPYRVHWKRFGLASKNHESTQLSK